MRIVLLGKHGQVGWELRRSLALLGPLIAFDRSEADLAQPDRLREQLRAAAPEIIVNAAAYTAVDKAEEEPELARRINTEAVALLAEEARRLRAWLVHYSTDYVFDGAKASAYRETDPTAPLNVYGLTKRDGEEAVRASGCLHLILRTSWIYAARGRNFLRTVLRLAAERDELEVVDDQRGSPTSAELVADVTAICLHLIRRDRELAARASGIYHLAASGETTWHGYARWLVTEARRRGADLRLSPEHVIAVRSADYPAPARRPANSVLDTSKLRTVFGLHLPDWEEGVARVLSEVLGD